MNIRQIIREAIDKTLMKRYQGQLEGYLGTFGIDTTPLGNNPRGVQSVQKFNDFAFEVDFALKHNLYKPSTGTRVNSTPQAAPQNNLRQRQTNTDDGVVTKTVNTVTDWADDAYQYARQAGLDGFDPLVGGTIRAFQNGYNGMQDKWNGQNNIQAQQRQQPQRQTPNRRRKPSGTDLTTLMGEPYRRAIQEINYAIQTIPGVRSLRYLNDTIVLLGNIKNALGQP
jgi:hypothetical protein